MATKGRNTGTRKRAPAKSTRASEMKATDNKRGSQRSIMTEAVCILVIAAALIVGMPPISDVM